MRNLSKTDSQTPKNRKHFCWFKLLLICLAVFVLAQLAQQYQRYQHIQAEVARQNQLLEIAQTNYEDLLSEAQLLECDSYIEQLARSQLGMTRRGEVVISPAEISDVPEMSEKVIEKDVFH